VIPKFRVRCPTLYCQNRYTIKNFKIGQLLPEENWNYFRKNTSNETSTQPHSHHQVLKNTTYFGLKNTTMKVAPKKDTDGNVFWMLDRGGVLMECPSVVHVTNTYRTWARKFETNENLSWMSGSGVVLMEGHADTHTASGFKNHGSAKTILQSKDGEKVENMLERRSGRDLCQPPIPIMPYRRSH